MFVTSNATTVPSDLPKHSTDRCHATVPTVQWMHSCTQQYTASYGRQLLNCNLPGSRIERGCASRARVSSTGGHGTLQSRVKAVCKSRTTISAGPPKARQAWVTSPRYIQKTRGHRDRCLPRPDIRPLLALVAAAPSSLPALPFLPAHAFPPRPYFPLPGVAAFPKGRALPLCSCWNTCSSAASFFWRHVCLFPRRMPLPNYLVKCLLPVGRRPKQKGHGRR